jgi:hypothetical protein
VLVARSSGRPPNLPGHGHSGIDLFNITAFSGSISNSSTISAGSSSGRIDVFHVSTFSDWIRNSGKIASKFGDGIFVGNVADFGNTSAGGGITNNGTAEIVPLLLMPSANVVVFSNKMQKPRPIHAA